MSKDEFVNYIRDDDNGLIKSNSSGDAYMELVYVPSKLLFSNNEENQHSYFTLKLSKSGKSLDRFFQLQIAQNPLFLNDLIFRISENIKLITPKGDTLNPLDINYNNLDFEKSSSTFLIVFDSIKTSRQEDINIYLSDIGLGIGLQKFNFQGNDILDASSIEINI